MVPMLPDVGSSIPLELTAPTIQRLVRKGIERSLTDDERVRLCDCVLFHIDILLAERRIPKTAPALPRARRVRRRVAIGMASCRSI